MARAPLRQRLLCPLRLLWRALRFLRSKKARRDSVAAAMARRHSRANAQPAGEPLLRRAVARARGAVDAMLRPGRRALAVGRDFLQRVLRVLPDFLRRLPPSPSPHKGRARNPRRRRPRAPSTSPPPTKGYARMYEDVPGRRRPRAPSTSPPPSPPPPQQDEEFTVDGEKVPKAVVRQYAFYCRVFSQRQSKNSEVCHFCVFDWKRSPHFTAIDMPHHCRTNHEDVVSSIPCDEAGCSVRLRRGREFTLHKHFFHVEAPDWWHKYT